MTQQIKSVLFRYENQKLTVLDTINQAEGYRVNGLRLYPGIQGLNQGDIYYSGAVHSFYKYDKQQRIWIKQNLEEIPKEIKAWCLVSGKPMK